MIQESQIDLFRQDYTKTVFLKLADWGFMPQATLLLDQGIKQILTLLVCVGMERYCPRNSNVSFADMGLMQIGLALIESYGFVWVISATTTWFSLSFGFNIINSCILHINFIYNQIGTIKSSFGIRTTPPFLSGKINYLGHLHILHSISILGV